MSERDEFERWAIDTKRAYRDEKHGLCFYDAGAKAPSWDAWQAARATQAVPALTDERRRAAAKALVEVYLGFPAPHREPGDLDLRAVDAVASIILAAPQPSPAP